MGKTVAFIGAGVLFLIGLCLLGYGALNIIGSTAAPENSSWLGFGIGFSFLGLIFFVGGGGLIWLGLRGQKTEVVQQVTMKVDLPGETKVSQMMCKACGGPITSNDIKMMAGAPVVTCPYCHATYTLTEEPKW